MPGYVSATITITLLLIVVIIPRVCAHVLKQRFKAHCGDKLDDMKCFATVESNFPQKLAMVDRLLRKTGVATKGVLYFRTFGTVSQDERK